MRGRDIGLVRLRQTGGDALSALDDAIVKMKNGVDLIHVPYKGSAPALTEPVAGRIDFLFDPITTALPFVKDGKLRALAITDSKRSPLVPEVPTLAELGYVGYDVNPWFGLAAPAGTPRPVIERLNAEFSEATKDPEVVKRLADQGIEATRMTPEQFAAFIKSVGCGETVATSIFLLRSDPVRFPQILRGAGLHRLADQQAAARKRDHLAGVLRGALRPRSSGV